MTRSLTLKLIFAFLIISLIGAALVALFARWSTITEFDRFLLEQARANFIADVSIYYQSVGSWAGIADIFGQQRNPPPPVPRPAADTNNLPPPPPPPAAPPRFGLVDQNDYVVIPIGQYRLGDRVPAAEVAQGTPVEIDGQVVGIVLNPAETLERDTLERQYLDRINQALLKAAFGATAIALLLGILLTRTLTRPLRELTTATRAMSKGDLEQRVPVRSKDELGELAASFNQMSADLVRANQLRRQMTADIAHDLRTPLSVIKGYTEALSDGVLEPTPDTLRVMHQEAEHLSLLVQDLRTLSLADAGELKLNRQPVSPRELLERTATAHIPQAQQLNIAVQVKVGAELPEIKADPDRMAQMLGNLVSNALRYTPEGGQIILSGQHQENAVLLSVQDNGTGIAPDKLPHIFARFYRGEKSRQPDHAGSGLGLAIAKAIVEAHGGTIAAESEPGRGTTFTMTLPVS